MGKLSPRLEATLTASSEPSTAGSIDVVVELSRVSPADLAGPPRAQREAMRQQFERASQPVRAKMEAAGGRVLGQAWINQTVRAQVPLSLLRELASLDEVQLVDLPSEIVPE